MDEEIEATADEVWFVLGERWGDLGWSRDILRSTVDRESVEAGAVRACHIAPSPLAKTDVIHETLLTFDRDARTLSYEATGLAGFLERAENRWSVTPLENGRCRVQSHATLEVTGFGRLLTPLLGWMLRRMGRQFLEDLTRQVEHNRRSPTETPVRAVG